MSIIIKVRYKKLFGHEDETYIYSSDSSVYQKTIDSFPYEDVISFQATGTGLKWVRDNFVGIPICILFSKISTQSWYGDYAKSLAWGFLNSKL